MSFGILDFIDADGVDLAERPVFQTPGNDIFDGVGRGRASPSRQAVALNREIVKDFNEKFR